MVITFDRHPRELLCTDWRPQLLTSLQEKEHLLAQTGVDRLVVLPFDRRMASLSAYDFMRQVLGKQLGVRLLLTGYDNRFGHRSPDSQEGFDDYVDYGHQLGIDVVCASGVEIDDDYVSSSRIRKLLADGQVAEAARCLGRCYQLQGVVEHGEQQGRQIGFPTANLRLKFDSAMVPRHGVYAVRIQLGSTLLMGMTNIGTRPTFDGHRLTIETHIFDFSNDIYGQPLSIEFVERLRDEQAFSTVDALAHQMALDAEQAKQILSHTI